MSEFKEVTPTPADGQTDGHTDGHRRMIEVDPELWFSEDDGYELAVFHSHVSAEPRPSRTDVENIGLWAGRPYLILSLRTGELAAFRIGRGGQIEELPLATRP